MDFSISDAIRQNTLGLSDGFPVGVPKSYNWYKGWNDDGMHAPPASFTAVEGWGQVYQQEGAPASSNPNTAVQVANAKTYVRSKDTGQWVLVQDQARSPIVGGHFVTDFAGNAGYAMNVAPLAGGGTSFAAPPSGYNDHFWYQSRGIFAAGTVDAVYVQMDMRITDSSAHLVAMVGADWWRDASAPYLHDHSNNPGVGGTNWVKLSTEWKTLGYYSLSSAELQSNLPPPLRAAVNTPPVTSNPDVTAPAAPEITAVAPSTGKAGDTITSVVTLSGTAEGGSTVKLFDGSTQIGTTRANANGAWSYATAELSEGTYSFTATATDAAGNTSSESSLLNVRVDAGKASSSAAPSMPNGENLLENEATSAEADQWAAFSGNDASSQTVQTVAVQSYNLSFDARPGPEFTGSTTTIEVLSNDTFILLALIFGAMIKIGRKNLVLSRGMREL
jgi:hypothetical protein